MAREVVLIQCDGGVQGRNDGFRTIGVGAVLTGAVTAALSGPVGRGSNNDAEYQALIYALRLLLGLVDPLAIAVEVRTDSELMARQVSGVYQANGRMAGYRDRALGLLRRFGEFRIIHVRREFNTVADSLAGACLTKRNSHGRILGSLDPAGPRGADRRRGETGRKDGRNP